MNFSTEDTFIDLPTNPVLITQFSLEKHLQLIPEVTQLLHTSYAPLAKQGLKYVATHQSDEVTESRLLKGWSFLGFANKQLISTITLVKDDPHEPAEWYQKPEVFFFTQFAVHPFYQGQGLGGRILSFVEDFALNNGAKELACDTSEKATHLISMYKKMGFRFIENADWSETNYKSVILSKNLFERNQNDSGSE